MCSFGCRRLPEKHDRPVALLRPGARARHFRSDSECLLAIRGRLVAESIGIAVHDRTRRYHSGALRCGRLRLQSLRLLHLCRYSECPENLGAALLCCLTSIRKTCNQILPNLLSVSWLCQHGRAVAVDAPTNVAQSFEVRLYHIAPPCKPSNNLRASIECGQLTTIRGRVSTCIHASVEPTPSIARTASSKRP